MDVGKEGKNIFRIFEWKIYWKLKIFRKRLMGNKNNYKNYTNNQIIDRDKETKRRKMESNKWKKEQTDQSAAEKLKSRRKITSANGKEQQSIRKAGI